MPPQIELDRSTLIKLPALADADDVAVPTALADAHRNLHGLANTAAAQAHGIIGDTRISETERTARLSGLCENTIAEIAKLDAVIATVAALADETEATTLRDAIGKYDPARLLAIATTVASRPREGRMSALLRARSDKESAAAMLGAPAELGVLSDIDPRMVDILRDALIDDDVRKSIASTRFAVARLRHGREAATATLRRMTRTTQAPRERIARIA